LQSRGEQVREKDKISKDWSYKATYALHAYVRICGRFALKKCNRDRLQLPPPSNMAGPSLES
jgi:hypothetical protein